MIVFGDKLNGHALVQIKELKISKPDPFPPKLVLSTVHCPQCMKNDCLSPGIEIVQKTILSCLFFTATDKSYFYISSFLLQIKANSFFCVFAWVSKEGYICDLLSEQNPSFLRLGFSMIKKHSPSQTWNRARTDEQCQHKLPLYVEVHY